MNIQEILKTGARKLRRKSWQDTQYIACGNSFDPDGQLFHVYYGDPLDDTSNGIESLFPFMLCSLLANDWEEVSPETYQKILAWEQSDQ